MPCCCIVAPETAATDSGTSCRRSDRLRAVTTMSPSFFCWSAAADLASSVVAGGAAVVSAVAVAGATESWAKAGVEQSANASDVTLETANEALKLDDWNPLPEFGWRLKSVTNVGLLADASDYRNDASVTMRRARCPGGDSDQTRASAESFP